MPFDTQKLATFPRGPGVYIMKDAKNRVLYIGKANNLQQRIRQYFTPGHETRPQIPLLLAKVENIETIQVFSEKEALLLENTLIKEHQPHYNILLKDDKSFVALRLSRDEWPRLELIRSKDAPIRDSHTFGPYRSIQIAKELLQLLQKTFPLRQCSKEEFARRTRPCLLYQMKRCIAPCVHLCTHETYDDLVQKALQFLRGSDKELLKSLRQEMEEKAAQLQFEEAALLRERIRHIEKGFEKQTVSSFSFSSADALALTRGGNLSTIARAIFRCGKLIDLEIRHFKDAAQDDSALLTSFILQEYLQKERPRLLLLPFQVEGALQELFTDMSLVVPHQGAKKNLVAIAAKNADHAFQEAQNALRIRESVLLDLKKELRLQNLPYRIDCFDNSHLGGTGTVSAMVHFVDGKKTPQGYRRYIIKEAAASDDYGAFREALRRRYSKNLHDLPDMLLVDGGKGQLSMAKAVFEELGLVTVDLVAIAKEAGRHDKGLSAEQILTPSGRYFLPPRSPSLFLLQQIRDEAHRFAISFQRKRRKIASELEDIPGIGPAKRRKLLKTFGSVRALKELSREALLEVLSSKDADQLLAYYGRLK